MGSHLIPPEVIAMLSNRFSITFRLVALVLCILGGPALSQAQAKKPGECADQPIFRPAPSPTHPRAARPSFEPPLQPRVVFEPRTQRRIAPEPPPKPRSILDFPSGAPSQPSVKPFEVPSRTSIPPSGDIPFDLGRFVTSEAPANIPTDEPVVSLTRSTDAASFIMDLAAEKPIYLCTQDGRPIYSGSDDGELCRRINQEVEGRAISAIKIEPRGLQTQKQDALLYSLSERQRRVNPQISLIRSPSGARLTESSTDPKPVPREHLFKDVFKLEGKTGSFTVFNRVKERLKYFVTVLRSRMSTELKYMTVEELIRKARADFEKTYPGPPITIEFRSEAGGTHWVSIPPRQRVRESWMRS